MCHTRSNVRVLCIRLPGGGKLVRNADAQVPGSRLGLRTLFVFFPQSDSNARGSWITLLISGDR